MLLKKSEARVQVTVVEFIRDAPAKRTEFPSLLDHGMHETNGIQEVAPLGRLDALQLILIHYDRVRTQEASAQSLWRFVGNFCDIWSRLRGISREALL